VSLFRICGLVIWVYHPRGLAHRPVGACSSPGVRAVRRRAAGSPSCKLSVRICLFRLPCICTTSNEPRHLSCSIVQHCVGIVCPQLRENRQAGTRVMLIHCGSCRSCCVVLIYVPVCVPAANTLFCFFNYISCRL
jgi:hypothetical protein